MENLVDDYLEKGLSDKSDNKADNDSNDETNDEIWQ